MESNEIKELIELISKSNFESFELEREGFRLKLRKAASRDGAGAPQPAARPGSEALVASAAAPPNPEAAAAEAEPDDGYQQLLSPIVGTFYSARGPDAPQFVEVGSRVTKGQVLCIVEAMKVMNEIESEIDAEVVEILVSNGQPVEYGELLFRLRPLS